MNSVLLTISHSIFFVLSANLSHQRPCFGLAFCISNNAVKVGFFFYKKKKRKESPLKTESCSPTRIEIINSCSFIILAHWMYQIIVVYEKVLWGLMWVSHVTFQRKTKERHKRKERGRDKGRVKVLRLGKKKETEQRATVFCKIQLGLRYSTYYHEVSGYSLYVCAQECGYFPCGYDTPA